MKALQTTQRGVALLAVLWLVAAMGLIITGIVKSVRGEIRTIGLQRQAVVANARADAAILLALQNLQSQGKEPGAPIQAISVAFEDLTSRVSVIPLNGRIDLNNAPVVLLADMYRYAGGLPADAAQALAQATVELRQVKTAKGNVQGFDASEESQRQSRHPGYFFPETRAYRNGIIAQCAASSADRFARWRCHTTGLDCVLGQRPPLWPALAHVGHPAVPVALGTAR